MSLHVATSTIQTLQQCPCSGLDQDWIKPRSYWGSRTSSNRRLCWTHIYVYWRQEKSEGEVMKINAIYQFVCSVGQHCSVGLAGLTQVWQQTTPGYGCLSSSCCLSWNCQNYVDKKQPVRGNIMTCLCSVPIVLILGQLLWWWYAGETRMSTCSKQLVLSLHCHHHYNWPKIFVYSKKPLGEIAWYSAYS